VLSARFLYAITWAALPDFGRNIEASQHNKKSPALAQAFPLRVAGRPGSADVLSVSAVNPAFALS